MNIEEQLKGMDGVKDDDLLALLTMPGLSNVPAKDPLSKIKSNLIIHSV